MIRCRIFLLALAALLPLSHPATAEEPAPTAPPKLRGLRFVGLNEQGYEEWVRVIDHAVMIRIPGGTYLQRPYEGAGEFEKPKPVFVDSYFIDKYEITNEQVAACWRLSQNTPPPSPPTLEELRRGPDEAPVLQRPTEHDSDFVLDDDPRLASNGQKTRAAPGKGRLPATVLTGHGARWYARYMRARLPSLAEWEKAAGGPEGRVFPWGDAKPDATRARFGRPAATGPAPVGSYAAGASPYGVMDMAGNVYERVFAPGRKDPVVIKGGSWLSPHPLNLRVLDMCVQPMGVADRSVGFRLVVNDPHPERPTWKPARPPVLRVASDFSEAMEEARERRVPIFLSLHYDTCGQCDRMRAELMRDPAFIKYANEHLVVIVGHHVGDAALHARKEDPAERPVMWPGLDETDLHSLFRRGLNVVGDFTVSPGNFLLDPTLVRPAAEARVHLVRPAAFSKWGGDTKGYLALFQRGAQALAKRLGAPVPRAEWQKQRAAEDAEDD